MAQAKTIIREKLAILRNSLDRIKGWERLTQADVDATLQKEREAMDLQRRLETVEEDVARCEAAVKQRFPKQLKNFPNVKYGSQDWFDSLEKSELGIKAQLTKRADCMRDAVQARDALNKIRAELGLALPGLQRDIDQVLAASALVQTLELQLKDEGVALPGLKGYLEDVSAAMRVLKDLLDALLKAARGGEAVDIEELKSWIGALEFNKKLIDETIKDAENITRVVNTVPLFRGWRIFCSNNAKSNLKVPEYMGWFKAKFDTLRDRWPMMLKGESTASWSYIVESKVGRGEISDNFRIIFEIVGDSILIYEFFNHKAYDAISDDLQNGTYKKPAVALLPVFSIDESVAA